MRLLVLAILAALLIYCLLEGRAHRRLLRAIPIRVLVNGTRGKTTTTRLIHAGLAQNGIKAYAKSTGSEAMTLDESLNAVPMARKTSYVSVGEVIAFMREAARHGVKAVVVECMAVRPDLQKSLARSLLKPTHTVLLNDYVDHVAAMGTAFRLSSRVIASEPVDLA